MCIECCMIHSWTICIDERNIVSNTRGSCTKVIYRRLDTMSDFNTCVAHIDGCQE